MSALDQSVPSARASVNASGHQQPAAGDRRVSQTASMPRRSIDASGGMIKWALSSDDTATASEGPPAVGGAMTWGWGGGAGDGARGGPQRVSSLSNRPVAGAHVAGRHRRASLPSAPPGGVDSGGGGTRAAGEALKQWLGFAGRRSSGAGGGNGDGANGAAGGGVSQPSLAHPPARRLSATASSSLTSSAHGASSHWHNSSSGGDGGEAGHRRSAAPEEDEDYDPIFSVKSPQMAPRHRRPSWANAGRGGSSQWGSAHSSAGGLLLPSAGSAGSSAFSGPATPSVRSRRLSVGGGAMSTQSSADGGGGGPLWRPATATKQSNGASWGQQQPHVLPELPRTQPSPPAGGGAPRASVQGRRRLSMPGGSALLPPGGDVPVRATPLCYHSQPHRLAWALSIAAGSG